MRIADYAPAMFKNALRGFLRTGSPGNLIDLRAVFPLRRDGAIVFEECLDRGLIDAETLEITENGKTIARAKVQHRTPISKAQTLLGDFLRRVDALNHDPRGVHYVEQVWLFGSLMRGGETVGDIDLALETSRRPQYADDHDGRRRRLDEIVTSHPNRPEDLRYPWSQETWVMNRALYGARRHPLLAGVQDSTQDLASLGVPCRLVYDRKRGGRVDDPIIPRHPQSNGRHNDIEPPAEMPDLTPRLIRPMDARWVAGFWNVGTVSPYDIFRDWNDDAHRLFPRYPEGLRVLGDDHDLRASWAPERLKAKGLDGREAIALVDVTPRSGVSIVLNRRIEISTTSWTLCASFSDLEAQGRRKRLDPLALSEITATAALILAVDVERMLRRAAESSPSPTVRIRFEEDGASDRVIQDFIEPTRDLLVDRAIWIEPPGWRGDKALVLEN
jgi:hypothetical protein